MLSAKKELFTPSGGAYQISRSVRLRSSASAYFNRTAGTPTNDKIFTFSVWAKRGALGVESQILSAGASVSDQFFFQNSTDVLKVYMGADVLVTSQVFRDPSAWYHIVLAVNTTQATASNRVKLYLNGTQITAFSSTAYPTQNYSPKFNALSSVLNIGRYQAGASGYFDGYLTEINFIDGQALTPSSFGETNSVTGVWQPKRYAGTYGNNGFYLNFSDNSNNTATTIGKDYSGNGNNWTPNNISVTAGTTYDSMIDVPTNYADGSTGRGNYAVWSGIDKASVTVSEANMAAVPATDPQAIRATIGLPASGKWYWEITVSALGYGVGLGVADNASNLTTGAASSATRTYQFGSWFNSFNGGVVQYGTSQALTVATNWAGASQPTANDIIMIAVDMDNGSMWVGKNGTWFNSSGTANPATNTDPRWTGLGGTTWFPYMSGYGSTTPVTCRINFGQRPFSYTLPSGYSALNTQNLPTPTISNGATVMAATLYAANGSTQTISNAVNGISMQPDFVWVKSRQYTTVGHSLFDALRPIGVNSSLPRLVSNSTDAETNNGGLTAFVSNGFSLNNDAYINSTSTGGNMVAWQWNAGGSTVTNTSGSISSQVRANATAGFSIATFSAPAVGSTPKTVGHGLGVAPSMIIVKFKSTASNWSVYHASVGNTKRMVLNLTDAASAASTQYWNNTNPSSTVFTIGSNFESSGADSLVAYCFAAVAGYSAFGSYTGNGSTDGPFVFLGFRPRFVMIKRTDAISNWTLRDTSRDASNTSINDLYANLSNAESSLGANIDILSNGFKCRDAGGSATNASGGTYIYAAFAENPFKNSLAR